MQLVKWVENGSGAWELKVKGKKEYTAAVVYPSGVWHTFNKRGVGGENWKEETVRQAKVEAAASAIQQGFI